MATSGFNVTVLVFGLLMTFVDMLTFPIVKLVSIDTLGSNWLLLPVFLYALQPLILFRSLQFEGIALMNLTWNTLSIIAITLIGVYYFKEKLSHTKTIGILLGMVSIGLLTYEG
jgi:multidrug transporter EmrE-like cation transporter